MDKGDKEKEAKEKAIGEVEKQLEQEESKTEEQPGQGGAGDVEQLTSKFLALYKALEKPPEGKSWEDTVVGPEEFEKDNDSNFHIDLMHSMGNCRAVCYKLDPMDWI